MKADRLTYCEKYSDGSRIEFAVEYANEPYLHDKTIAGTVSITHIDTATFPITKLDWLIDSLERVRQNLNDKGQPK